MNDKNDDKYNQAMQEFERLRIKGEYQRAEDDRESEIMRRNLYRTGHSRSYRTRDEEIDDFFDALPAGVGIVFGAAIAYMLKAHDIGVYVMLGALGFYAGVFVKHNAFQNEDAVTSFRNTMPALFIAMAAVLTGFISLFVDIF